MLTYISNLLPSLGFGIPDIIYSKNKRLCVIDGKARYINIVERVKDNYYLAYQLLLQCREVIADTDVKALDYICKHYELPPDVCEAIYWGIIGESYDTVLSIVRNLIRQHPGYINSMVCRSNSVPIGLYHLFPHVSTDDIDINDSVIENIYEQPDEFIYLHKAGKFTLPALTTELEITLDKRILQLYPNLNSCTLAHYRLYGNIKEYNHKDAGHVYLAYLCGIKPDSQQLNSGSLLKAIAVANNDYNKLKEIIGRLGNTCQIRSPLYYQSRGNHIATIISMMLNPSNIAIDLDDCPLCQEFRNNYE